MTANTYLGAVIGTGVESRRNDKTSARVELRGFVRGRVDGQSEDVAFSAATSTNEGVSLGVGLVLL